MVSRNIHYEVAVLKEFVSLTTLQNLRTYIDLSLYEQFHITNTSIHLIQIFPEAFLQFFNAIHSGGQEGLNLAILLLILRCSIAQPNKLKN